LAEAIRKLRADAPLRVELGIGARRVFDETFAIRALADTLARILR
jgi:hypothetical protein